MIENSSKSLDQGRNLPLTQATRETKENVKKTADIDKDVDFLMNKMQSLEAEVNATERYSRSNNARFLGVPEITGEQCAKVVDDIITQQTWPVRLNNRTRAPHW